jgi:hypothetical protein
MIGAVLAGTNTGEALWADGVVGRGARALGKGRGSSARRIGIMGGEGEENDGMLRIVGVGKRGVECDARF